MSRGERKDINFLEAFHKKGLLDGAIRVYGEAISNAAMAKESLEMVGHLGSLLPKTSIPASSQTRYLKIIKEVEDSILKKLASL